MSSSTTKFSRPIVDSSSAKGGKPQKPTPSNLRNQRVEDRLVGRKEMCQSSSSVRFRRIWNLSMSKKKSVTKNKKKRRINRLSSKQAAGMRALSRLVVMARRPRSSPFGARTKKVAPPFAIRAIRQLHLSANPSQHRRRLLTLLGQARTKSHGHPRIRLDIDCSLTKAKFRLSTG